MLHTILMSFSPADEETCSNEESLNEESQCESSEDVENIDPSWCEGSPLKRKRFFVYENDRTLDPTYNIVEKYETIKNDRQSYVKEWMRRRRLKEEDGAGFDNSDFDASFKKDEVAS